MGATSKKYDITDSTGSTIQIAAYSNRSEIWLRNAGPNTVYLGVNEAAVSTAGFYIDSGAAFIIDGIMATRNIYMVCAAGETASVFAELE